MQPKNVNLTQPSERQSKPKKRSLLNFKTILLVILCYAGLMALMLSVSFSQIHSLKEIVFSLDQWVKSNNIIIVFWHILVILAIWWGWGKKVDSDARKYGAKEAVIKRAKAFRYYLIAIILIMDLLFILSRPL